MAAENAREFLDRLATEASFRAGLQAMGVTKVTTIMDFALSKGYVFSERDLRDALAEYPDNPAVNQMRDQLKIPYAARTS